MAGHAGGYIRIWAILLAGALSVAIGIAAGMGMGLPTAALCVALVGPLALTPNHQGAKWVALVVVLVGPYYQYRFDLPLVPFHFSLHRMALVLAFAAVLVQYLTEERHSRPEEAGMQSVSFITPALAWLFAWTLIELIASWRSDYAVGLNRLLPRIVNLGTALLLILVLRNLRLIRFFMLASVAAAIIPAAVALWQLGTWITTGTFVGLPLQDYLAANLSVFEEAYKGAGLINAPGLGVFPRVASVMVDANYLGVFMSTTVIIVLGLLLQHMEHRQSRRSWISIAGIALLVLFLALNLLTFSRSGLLALLLGVGTLFLLQWRVRGTGRTWFILMIVGTAVLVLLSIVSTRTSGVVSALLEQRLGLTGIQSGLLGRSPHLAAAMTAFGENPLVGVGAQNTLSVSQYYTGHSSPVTLLAEFGVFGFLVFYIGLFACIRPILVALKECRRNVDLVYTCMTLLAAGVALMASTLGYDLLFNLEMNWVLLGILLAMGGIARSYVQQQDSCVEALKHGRAAPSKTQA